MSYANRVTISASDSPSIDAFDRWRVSAPFGLFDGKLLGADQPLLWSDETISGAASSSYAANTSSATLALSAQTGVRVRQTKQRFSYQPGKSQEILVTFTLGAAVANVTKRVGYFDDNNGLFLQQTSTALSLVRRTYVSGSAVDNAVAQASWNLDTLDGNGPSGITLDVTKSQILFIDFEWLGVGRVRFGFVVDGIIRYCHQILNANVLAGVYMTTPSLPIRYELRSTSNATATLECICSSVMSEGGSEPPGLEYSIDRGITAFTTGNNTSLYPVLAYRVAATQKEARISPANLSIICTSTANYRWALILNPTITGTALSFSAVTNTGCEAQVNTTNATTASGGFVIASGYNSDTNQPRSAVYSNVSTRIVPGFSAANVADVVALCIQNLNAGTEDYYASIGLSEVS